MRSIGRALPFWEQVPLVVQDSPLTAESPFRVSVQSYAESTLPAADIHHSFEIGVQLEGAQERYTGGHAASILPGDVWLNAMWEPHSLRIAAQSMDVVVMFRPEFLGEETVDDIPWLTFFALPAGERPRIKRAESRETALGIAQDMCRETRTQPLGWRTAVRLDVLRLLLELSRNWGPRAHQLGRPGSVLGDLDRILPAVELAYSRPAKRVTVAEAASACFLSERHFRRLFENAMGLSFGRFCLRSRCGIAAQLLLTTPLSEKEIAERTGFIDASHLHHAFVRQYSATPGRYRQQRELQSEVTSPLAKSGRQHRMPAGLSSSRLPVR